MTKKPSHSIHRSSMGMVAITLALAGSTLLASRAAHAQQPPSAFDLVTQLDYECRPTAGAPLPPILIRQLNPVLKDQIPNQWAQIGELQQLCVPVAKNNQIPTQPALAFIENSDLACYKASTPVPADVDLKLTHLNPQLHGLPDEFVHIGELQSVCVPVRKNNAVIPPAIRLMDSHIDQACYSLLEPTPSVDKELLLTHLNPVIRAMNFPDRKVTMRRAHQLCVPIAKNDEPVPPGVSLRVRYADFLKYRVDVEVPPPPYWLQLTHLNPIFAGLPPFQVLIDQQPVHLMVPVAKNDNIPPKD